jgi:hypothetical protein
MSLDNPNGPGMKRIDPSGLECGSCSDSEPLFLQRTVYPERFWLK